MSQSREKDDDTDMAISYANRLPPASHSSQTLPSFRELLPPHLHEEIDSTTYYTSPRHQSQERPVSGHEMADPRSIPYATNAPPSKMGYGDPHREYAVSRSGEPHPSRHLPDQGHLQMRRGENPSPTAPRFAAARGPSPILPPIRNLQPGVNAPTKAYPDSRVPPRSDPYGTQDYRGGQPPVDPRADPYLTGRGPPMMHHPPSPYGHAMPYHGEGEPMHSQMMGHPQQANFGIMGDPIDPKTKRRRGNLPKPVTDILRAWFHEHLDHPYPSEEDKQMFMTRTGLSISQISNWFINARRRQLPALRNQMRSGTTDTDSQRQSPFSDIEPTSPQ